MSKSRNRSQAAEIVQGVQGSRRRYFSSLMHDVFVVFWRQTFLVLGISVGNVILSVAAAGSIFLYISLLENGQPINLGAWQIPITGSLSEIAVGGLIAGVLFLLGSLSSYGVRVVVIRIARNYYRHCLKDAVERLNSVRQYPEWDCYRPTDQNILSILIADTRYAMAFYSSLLLTILPVLTFIATMIGLFVLSPMLGLVVAVSLMIFSPLYLLLFTYSKNLQADLTKNARKHAVDLGRMSRAVLYGPIHDSYRKDDAERWVNNTSTGSFLTILAKRQALSERAGLVSSFGGAAATTGFVFFVAHQVVSESGSIAALTTVMVIFRYMIASFNSIITRASNMHAFMPLSARLMAFRFLCDDIIRLEPTPTREVSTDTGYDGETRLAVYSSRSVGRLEADRLTRRLGLAVAPSDLAFVSAEVQPFAWDWDLDLTGGHWTLPEDGAAFAARYPEMAAEAESYDAFRALLADPIDTEALAKVPTVLRLLFAIQTALARGQSVLVIRGSDWSAADAASRAGLEALLGDRIAIFVYEKAVTPPKSVQVAFIDTMDGVERIEVEHLTTAGYDYIRQRIAPRTQEVEGAGMDMMGGFE